MKDALILGACRTPIGRYRGALSSAAVSELGGTVVRAAVDRSDVDPSLIDEVIMGNVLTAGVGQAPARQAALKGGLSPAVSALTVNKVCGSGLKAVMLAAQAVRCGEADVVVAGGMESMSNAGHLRPRHEPEDAVVETIDTMLHDGLTCAHSQLSMGIIAENVADADSISRQEQDAYALESHRRACRAIDAGAFSREIVPFDVSGNGAPVTVTRDEGPRSDTSLDKLGSLRTVFREDGSVTAGNASMVSDGAAAVVVAGSDAVERSGVRPVARIICSATAGERPEDLFIAPVAAIRKVLAKSGRSPADIDLFEINEAFASQMLACLRRLELDPDKVNVHGGAIALGHPIGASGARVLVTLLHALQARQQHSGIASLCLGGGNAVAMLVELV